MQIPLYSQVDLSGVLMQEETRTSREAIEKLNAKFEENIEQYKSAQYDEANTRLEFIDEFFKYLDCDVGNK